MPKSSEKETIAVFVEVAYVPACMGLLGRRSCLYPGDPEAERGEVGATCEDSTAAMVWAIFVQAEIEAITLQGARREAGGETLYGVGHGQIILGR